MQQRTQQGMGKLSALLGAQDAQKREEENEAMANERNGAALVAIWAKVEPIFAAAIDIVNAKLAEHGPLRLKTIRTERVSEDEYGPSLALTDGRPYTGGSLICVLVTLANQVFTGAPGHVGSRLTIGDLTTEALADEIALAAASMMPTRRDH